MLNWLDKTISFVSPVAGAKRARARALIGTYNEILKRKYEGAASGRRTDGWVTTGTSANAESYSALLKLRARARDLTRNNAYASRALQVIASNTIGSGIVPSIQTKQARQAERLQGLWESWADSTDCDADGSLDFFGLQSLIMRTTIESGECLIRRRIRRSTSGLAIPMQLQILEPDFLDQNMDQRLPNGNIVIQGVEFNSVGKRVAYYLFMEHPGGTLGSAFQYKTVRVPASEVIHHYRVDRPGQVRGIPWAAPVMLRLKDFDDYEDAQLIRQKVAACYAAFVHDINTDELSDEQRAIAEKIEPGVIEILPPGKTVTFADPPGVQNYGEYTSAILHAIAVGFGVTYESLTGDLSQVNFSSGRMGHLEFQRNIDQWRWNMHIPKFCQGAFSWFLEAADLTGVPTEGVRGAWTPPAREMIDPAKEINANTAAIRSGQKSLSETLREQGMDPNKVFAEIKSDNNKIDALGLVFDSDPRKTSGAGQSQTVAAASV